MTVDPFTLAGRVILREGRDGPVRGGNPWIFSQAIARTEPSALPAGSAVAVADAKGNAIGCGHYHPATTIAVRMLQWSATPDLESALARRLRAAFAMRGRMARNQGDCCRLVNGDGDGLSGIVIDRYADVCVLQLLTAGADRMREWLVEEIRSLAAPRAILERSQGAVRRQEGLGDSVACLAGENLAEVIATENGLKVAVDLERGQKTGAFLDQRENRQRFGALANDARVLDACCYAGGFALAALAQGAARVVAADTSARALGFVKRNLELNGFAQRSVELVHGDVARYLAQTTERFDLAVLDPPPLARSRADASRAGHLYAQLNATAMNALDAGGVLMTFSCSVHFRGEDFVRAVRIAQVKAQRRFKLVARLGAGADHPVLLGHVEGEYLTGLLLAEL
ncbi:MAG: class I SAM-dependent rRNA methyltransferase [Candidatus Binataceae bacterium]